MPKLDGLSINDITISDLIKSTGENPACEGLKDTPTRFLKAWEFWTSGYSQDANSVIKTFVEDSDKVDEMIFVGNITFFSLCKHHLAPFFGLAHIAYIPDGRIVGLSKFARLVEVFSRRLQVQEQLCQQVADALMNNLSPKGVGVVMQCRHLCMESRGVQRYGSVTITSALRGCIKEESEARSEFMSMVTTAASGFKEL